jgi:hypothetical protein
MCENMTHIAIGEDSLRLAALSPDVCQAFKEVIADHLEIAKMGTVNRNMLGIRLLQRIRDDWATRRPEDDLEKKLAYWLGSMLHSCGDHSIWPVYNATLNPDDPYPQSECREYHDVFLFKEVFENGAKAPYFPGLLDVPQVRGSKLFTPDVERFFQALMRRALLALHRVIPAQDANDWLTRILLCREKSFISLANYAEIYHHPDPVKVERYITGPNFYDPSDPIIALARTLQRGEPVAWQTVEQALSSAETQSYYAQALARGYRYLKAASLHFLDEITLKELLDALDFLTPDAQNRSFYSRWVHYFVVGKEDEVRFMVGGVPAPHGTRAMQNIDI